MTIKISKKLSANDIGKTGGHQAGILVPKLADVLSFFPALNAKTYNPRTGLVVREQESGERWSFNFIYYNNKLFKNVRTGKFGTRNEYRLTCMTKYLRAVDAKIGDELLFSKNEDGSILVSCVRAGVRASGAADDETLVLSGGWKVVSF